MMKALDRPTRPFAANGQIDTPALGLDVLGAERPTCRRLSMRSDGRDAPSHARPNLFRVDSQLVQLDPGCQR